MTPKETKPIESKVKRATFKEALPGNTQRQSQLMIVELFGKIEYAKAHHYKKHRKRS